MPYVAYSWPVAIPDVTSTQAGLMTPAMLAKLNGGIQTFVDLADFCKFVNGTNIPDNYTLGAQIYTIRDTVDPSKTIFIDGIKTFWAGSPTTLKGTLYRQSDSAVLATANLAVPVAGEYSITFVAPFASTPYESYILAVRDLAGLEITSGFNTVQYEVASDAIDGGSHFRIEFRSLYNIGQGDSVPDTSAGPDDHLPDDADPLGRLERVDGVGAGRECDRQRHILERLLGPVRVEHLEARGRARQMRDDRRGLILHRRGRARGLVLGVEDGHSEGWSGHDKESTRGRW